MLFQYLLILPRLFIIEFLSWVRSTALPVSGLTTRAIAIRVFGYSTLTSSQREDP